MTIKCNGPPLPLQQQLITKTSCPPLSSFLSFILLTKTSIFLLLTYASMAIIRSMSQLNIKAPPPSPVPTATGTRSAANKSFTDFLENSLQVPDLSLPESQPQSHRHPGLPDKIDLRSLALRESDSVERLLRSAREFGVVEIAWHGMNTADGELRAWVKEAARVFSVLEERDTGVRRHLAGKREEIVWVSCKDERMEWARHYIGAQLYHSFSEKMEKVGSKLEEVAEELGKIFVENVSKQAGKRLQRGESLLSIYKFNQQSKMTQQSPYLNEEENDHSCDYTLSLHLPTKDCQFSLKSGPRLLTFEAGPDTIIVTVGQQLEEWSMGEFKCVPGRIIYQPTEELSGSQSSFSMELKWSSLNINHTYKTTTYKKISLADQFFIALVIVFFYSVFILKNSP